MQKHHFWSFVQNIWVVIFYWPHEGPDGENYWSSGSLLDCYVWNNAKHDFSFSHVVVCFCYQKSSENIVTLIVTVIFPFPEDTSDLSLSAAEQQILVFWRPQAATSSTHPETSLECRRAYGGGSCGPSHALCRSVPPRLAAGKLFVYINQINGCEFSTGAYEVWTWLYPSHPPHPPVPPHWPDLLLSKPTTTVSVCPSVTTHHALLSRAGFRCTFQLMFVSDFVHLSGDGWV